jgi:phosphate transport system substrate-binding protein
MDGAPCCGFAANPGDEHRDYWLFGIAFTRQVPGKHDIGETSTTRLRPHQAADWPRASTSSRMIFIEAPAFIGVTHTSPADDSRWPPRSLQRFLAGLAACCLAVTLHAGETDWSETGRPLPQRESRQPQLDPDLPPFLPCDDASVVTVTGSAPAILPDLVARWGLAFAKRCPGITIEVPPPYGGPQGALSPQLQDFLKGLGDFAFLTRAMSVVDRHTFQASRGHAPVIVPVASGSFRHLGFVDPVVVVVNDANPLRQLRPVDLQRLFASHVAASSRPRSWADLGVPGWADRPVTVVGGARWGNEDSARGLVVRARLLANDSLRADLGPASGSEAGVPAQVAANPNAIGFTGLGHLRPGIHPLAIADETGEYIAPTFENVAGARYPLARTVDLVIATPPGQSLRPGLAEFVCFLLSRDGQSVVLEQGIFLPLRASQVRAAVASLGLTDSGCLGAREFPGAGQPGGALATR